MLRRFLLVIVSVVVSFGLTAIGGYVLYKMSAGSSEYQLSWFANHLFTPSIAVVTGFLVGILSRDHPVPTAIIGLAPWSLSLNLGRPTLPMVGTWVELELLAGVAAALSWRFAKRVQAQVRRSRPSKLVN